MKMRKYENKIRKAVTKREKIEKGVENERRERSPDEKIIRAEKEK